MHAPHWLKWEYCQLPFFIVQFPMCHLAHPSSPKMQTAHHNLIRQSIRIISQSWFEPPFKLLASPGKFSLCRRKILQWHPKWSYLIATKLEKFEFMTFKRFQTSISVQYFSAVDNKYYHLRSHRSVALVIRSGCVKNIHVHQVGQYWFSQVTIPIPKQSQYRGGTWYQHTEFHDPTRLHTFAAKCVQVPKIFHELCPKPL